MMDMDWIKVKERDIEFEYRYTPERLDEVSMFENEF